MIVCFFNAMKPTLVFLHGLLGTQAGWQKLSENLPHFDCIALDLPWHGSAKNYPVQDFDETCAYVAKQIQRAVGNQPYFLVGYSLGGRIALYYALYSQQEKNNVVFDGWNCSVTTARARKTKVFEFYDKIAGQVYPK